MLELALKLADEESSFLAVALFEDVADADEDSPGDGGDRGGHGEREEQQQLLPQWAFMARPRAKRWPDWGAPSAPRRRSRTRPPTAKARGKIEQRNEGVRFQEFVFDL